MTGRSSEWGEVAGVPDLPARPADGHKGTFGAVLVLAGQVGMAGAAILAARGAARAGAGLVRVGVPPELLSVVPLGVPMATSLVAERSGAEALHDAVRLADAVVVGPGLGQDARARFVVESVLRHARSRVVFDADGLNVVAPLAASESPESRGSWSADPRLEGLRDRGVEVVLTPHPGEAGRLLGQSSAQVQADRPAAVMALAQRSGAVAVLKGAATLVADGRRLYRNATGNPGLATGGSGDVLAGVLGALMAQGMSAFDAACLGVHVHGAAGDSVARDLSMAGLTAEDLPLAVARILRAHESEIGTTMHPGHGSHRATEVDG